MHPSHSPSGRLTALGTQLIEIHHWLREELARLRASLDSGDVAAFTSGHALLRFLRRALLASGADQAKPPPPVDPDKRQAEDE